MILPIYTYGQPVLREETKEIDANYPELKVLIENMFETLAYSEGVGLAAPQVGLPIRLFIVDLTPIAEEQPEYTDFKRTYINPNIYEESEEECSISEGCLSLPGISENIQRPEKVRISYFDENFVAHDEEVDDYLARVIQHEYDHLEGLMFIDHIKGLRKQMIKTKLANILKGKIHASYKTKSVRIK